MLDCWCTPLWLNLVRVWSGFKVRVGNVLQIRHEVRGCMPFNLWSMGFAHFEKRNTHMQTHSRVDIHIHSCPHKATTKPAGLPQPCWHRAAIGNIRPCPVWLAGQCAVCPGGAQVTGLSCCCHCPQPSELLSHSDLRQHTVCCFIRSLHHL